MRFIRKDNGPSEKFFYRTFEEAFVHLALFRDDNSGTYKRIEIVAGVNATDVMNP